MHTAIYLPDPLSEAVEEYLKGHPETSLSALVQEALEARLAPKNPAALLELAGLVKTAFTPARENAEDRLTRRER